MFMGTYQNSIDAKKRMIVPAKFREELGSKVVLTLGIDDCLYLYTASAWQEFADKLAKLPVSDPQVRRFVRNFMANAEECEVDTQGRLTIPQMLREKVDIKKELTTIGAMNKIEIWSRSTYEASLEELSLSQDEIAEGMLEYGI